jgi:hypothetical protein
MSSNINPLILSGTSLNDSITNLITDENLLMQLANQNDESLSKVAGFDSNTIEGINIGINSVLENIPLKGGCCMRKQNDNTAKSVKVRVKLEPGAMGNLKKYGFEWKSLSIPASTCPANLYNGSPDCDTFYDVYCENVNKVFLEDIGRQLDDDSNQYPNYAPDCACYAPLAIGQESTPVGVPAACYKADCAATGKASYPDPTSRTQPCDTTICSSVINTAGMKVGGAATINPTVVQECGSSAVTKSVGAESLKSMPKKPADNTNKIIISACIYCCCILSIVFVYYMFIRKTPRRV